MTTAATGTVRPALADPDNLADAARTFVRTPTPWILGGYFACALAARLVLGGWNWKDAVIPLVLVALQPFTEWVIHVTILHFKPRTVLGRRLDLPLAREHRLHHLDPRNLRQAFTPLLTLLVDVPILVALAIVLLPDVPRTVTGVATGMAIFCVYEWTHYLIHTSYRPKGRYFRSIEQAHRLHHYRNEHYWMGVTNNFADHVLRTFPAKTDVPLSPTARTLGVDDA